MLACVIMLMTIMIMAVHDHAHDRPRRLEKFRLDFEDAVEVEGVAA